MDEVGRQVEAWAEAAGDAGMAGAPPVAADEVIASPRRGGPSSAWLRPTLAAAAVLVLVGAFLVVRSSGDDDVEPVQSGPTTTAPPSEDPGFEVLNVGLAVPSADASSEPPIVSLRAASTQAQLEELWFGVRYLEPERSSVPPVPTVDFDRQVVLAISIPDDACPPELVGFLRVPGEDEPDRLVPKFVQPDGVCEEPLIPKQYVVAVDWAWAGDRFTLHVDADDLAAEGALRPLSNEAGTGVQEIRLDRARGAAGTVIDIDLPTTTVEAGGTISGMVIVSNNTGEVIEGSGCGNEYWLALRNDEFQQQFPMLACLRGYEVLPGTTAYPVSVNAAHPSCVSDPSGSSESLGLPTCAAGGLPPALDPGRYDAVLEGQSDLPTNVDPVSIEVT